MRSYKVYAKINDKWTQLDTFEDESVNISRSIKDVRDVSKLFSTHTKNFTLPSTPTNDSAFRFYTMPEVSDGLDPHVGIEAFIEAQGIRISQGYLEFLGGRVQKGNTSFYNVTFMGELAQLNEVFGEDNLEDLDWSAYDHTMNYSNVTASWGGNLLGGAVLYPLVDYERGWVYSSSGSVNDKRNIADSQYGILLSECKPAITFQAIIDTLESEYGLTFNLDADITASFDKTHMLLHRDAGDLINQDAEQEAKFGAIDEGVTVTAVGYTEFVWSQDFDNGGYFDASAGTFTAPETGYYTFSVRSVDYQATSGTPNVVLGYAVNNGTKKIFDTLYSGANVFGGNSKLSKIGVTLRAGDTIELFYKLSGSGTFTIDVVTWILESVKVGLFNRTADLGVLMPKDFKVVDWFKSVIQMFNLVVIPQSATEFDVIPYPLWLEDGSVRNYTRYWDLNSFEVSKVPINRLISFTYEEGKDLASEYFANYADRPYGSTEYRVDKDFADGSISVEPKFAPVLPVTLLNQDVNSLVIGDTGMYILKMLNRESKPVVDSPRVFWFTGMESCLPYYLQSGVDASGNEQYTQMFEYPLISMFEDFDSSASSSSINFSLEEPLNGVPALGTLYDSYYGDYIQRLYDPNVRLVKATAILPLSEYLKLQMNDQVILGGNYYTINQFKYNLLTEKAEFELMQYFPNYVRQRVNSVEIDGTIGFSDGVPTTTIRRLFNATQLSGATLTWQGGFTFKTVSVSGKKIATELPLDNNNGSDDYGIEG